MWSPAILIICFAILNSCVSWVLKKKQSESLTHTSLQLSQSIFVCCVTYLDSMWLESVLAIMKEAKYPSRVFIGVVEFVEDSTQSMAEQIPWKYRNNIRILTRSVRNATTLCEARKLCIKKLFRNEQYTLFCRSITLHKDWDATLCDYMNHEPSAIITTQLTQEEEPIFAIIEEAGESEIKVGYKRMFMQTEYPVRTIVWCADFSFGESRVNPIVLQDETALGVSSMLHEKRIQIFCPGSVIGKRGLYPRGLRQGTRCLVDPEFIKRFYASLDMKGTEVSRHALSGLSHDPESHESICKYGSIWQARLHLQNTESEIG